MSQEIHLIRVKDFIRTRGVGKIDLEISKRNLENLCKIWRKGSPQNVLVDLRQRTIQLTPREVRLFLDIVIGTGLGTDNRIAILYKHRAPFDPAKFLEFLAVGRGMSIRAFEEYEAAVQWLGVSAIPTSAAGS